MPLQSAAQEAAPAPGRSEIVAQALATHKLADGKAYKWGGHSTKGFDCSGFVIYVLQQAYPQAGWTFITAGQIFKDSRFQEVVGPPQPGDLICFRPSRGLSHDHIGIVLDDVFWMGSQSSTGVKPVRLKDVWWSRHPHFFLRLK